MNLKRLAVDPVIILRDRAGSEMDVLVWIISAAIGDPVGLR